MLRLAVLLLVVIVTAAAAAMLWQHRRYVHARRAFAQDHQPALHSADAFHVVTFLELAPGSDLFDSVRQLRDAVEAGGNARLIYAGKVALNARPSEQLIAAFGESVPWDAIVCVQFDSRDDWDRIAARGEFDRALSPFARTYSHGMQRSAWTNLAIPQGLLARRIQQIVKRTPSQFPFEPAPKSEWVIPREAPFQKLTDQRELGSQAVVIVNLIQPGSSDAQEADRDYVGRMFDLMAEVGNGPLHMGRAVTLQNETRFESVAIVYYPGVDYFRSMAESRFYQGIIGNKQLGDNQASITVPITDRL